MENMHNKKQRNIYIFSFQLHDFWLMAIYIDVSFFLKVNLARKRVEKLMKTNEIYF
jgi:hypothetical protein